MQQNFQNATRRQTEELTPSELVKRHIEDPNHVITDEELRSVKLVLDEPLRMNEGKSGEE